MSDELRPCPICGEVGQVEGSKVICTECYFYTSYPHWNKISEIRQERDSLKSNWDAMSKLATLLESTWAEMEGEEDE